MREASEATHVPERSVAPVRCGVGSAGRDVALQHAGVHVGALLHAILVSANRTKATHSAVSVMKTLLQELTDAGYLVPSWHLALFDKLQ